MNVLDVTLLSVAFIGMVYGLKVGLVKQLTLGASIVLGLLQATIFYQRVGNYIQEVSGWENWVCLIVGFISILMAVSLVVNLTGILLRLLLKIVFLGWIDKIMGALFSMFVSVAILAFAVKISNVFMPDNALTGETTQQESLLYKKVAGITFTIIEEVKDEVKDEMDID